MKIAFVVVFVVVAVLGLHQCWRGHRYGRMWAYDPAGSSFATERSDGCFFVVGWWVTLALSLAALAGAALVLVHGKA